MKALYLSDDGLLLRTDFEEPRPGPGEALIRLTRAGICATDLELVRGYKGFRGVLGHEFAGVVDEAEERRLVGRRVVGTINVGCGRCQVCLGSGAEHCPRRKVLGISGKDGAFAERFILPARNLLKIPETLADEEAVFTEPLAAALRIREQVPVPPTARIAVIGPGRLGLLIAQVLALAGNRLHILGRRAATLELPRTLGLEAGLAVDAEESSYDLVVEATGNEAGLRESLRLVRPRGTLVLKSTFAAQARLDLSKVIAGEINLVGSRCGPFAPALRLLAAKAIAVAPLVEGEYPLDEGLLAFDHAARPGVRKILLRPR